MSDMHRIAFWSLAAFVFAIPWERSVAIPFIGAAGTPFGAVALVLGLASVLDAGKIKLRPPSLLLVAMAVFVLWSLVGYFWSLRPSATLARTITYGQLLAMVWLVWQLTRSERQWHILLQAYVAGAYFAILVVIWNFVRGEATLISMNTGLTRFSVAGGDPNYLALTLVVAIPMAWLLFLETRRRMTSLIYLGFIPLAVIVVGLTGSRGGVISAIIALMIIPLTYWRLHFWRKLAILLSLGLMVLGLLFVLPEATVERFLDTPDAISEDDLAGRVQIWQAGLDVLSNNGQAVVIGVGSSNFRYAVERAIGRDRTAHNAYLNVWVDNGVIGLAIFLSFFVVAALPYLSGWSKPGSFALVTCVALAVGVFGLSWEREKVLWFILAVLVARNGIQISTARGRPTLSNNEPDSKNTLSNVLERPDSLHGREQP